MNRPFCKACNRQPAAVNYYRNNVPHYRSRCAACIRLRKKERPSEPKWKINGYKKKPACDLCGFRSKYSSQIVVCHVDGNMNNCELYNLRSICLCCVEVVKRRTTIWHIGAIEADH